MISKVKTILIMAGLLTLLPLTSFATETWNSGETQFIHRRGLTGGGTALDAVSGVSMSPGVVAVSIDTSGASVYFHVVSPTGNASGTTAASAPDWIMPLTAANGQSLAGVSMWKMLGVTGVTAVFKTLYIDGTRWDNGSGGMSETVVRAAVTPTVLDKSTDAYLPTLPDPVTSDIDASKAVSGASPIYSHTTGTSVVLGTFILNDSTTSKVYGLPIIPATGVSVPYTIFSEGAAGGGITVYPTAAQPFQGDGLSGTSYLALPPGKPFESATIFGVNNGTTTYWFVQATASWVAGN